MEEGKDIAMGNTGGGKPAEHNFPQTQDGGSKYVTENRASIRKDVADTAVNTPAHPADDFGVKEMGKGVGA